MELVYLKDIVIILALAVAIVALFTRLRVPTIAGFIAAGVVVGPQGLALVSDPHQVQFLAEIGVTLLLFAIGLELPLEHLRRLWKAVLIGGGLQVSATITLCVLVGRAFGLDWGQAIFVGCVIAISSTAIVLRGLEQRGEIDAPHGRFTLGVLLFQDMCVAPMIMIIPTLSSGSAPGAGIAEALLRAALIIGAAILAGKYLVPRLMDIVARTRQRQLFIMTALLLCVGTAWVTASAGITLALGAFLAGVIVGGSQYRHQTLSDIIPFREVFISLFFVSIGMLLDLREIAESLAPIAILLIGILALKFAIVFLTGLALRAPLRVSVMSATALAQVGEFSFVLLGAGAALSLIGEQLTTQLTVAIALSMLVTPLLLSLAPRFAAGVGRLGLLAPAFAGEESTEGGASTASLRDHVIIGGYGLAGADLARGLRDSGEPYIIVDLNPDNVRLAQNLGEPIHYGDITSEATLAVLGISRARMLVVVINDPDASVRAVKAARRVAPNLHILVRTRYLMDTSLALEAGASEVVPAELEASIEVTARALRRCQVDESSVERKLHEIRELHKTGEE